MAQRQRAELKRADMPTIVSHTSECDRSVTVTASAGSKTLPAISSRRPYSRHFAAELYYREPNIHEKIGVTSEVAHCVVKSIENVIRYSVLADFLKEAAADT